MFIPLGALARAWQLLCKFSTVLLVPWVAALMLVWIALEPTRRARYLRGLAILAGSAALLILLPYLWATADYPPDRQLRDTYFTFFRVGGGPAGCAGDASAEADYARLLRDCSRDLHACVSRPPEGGLPRLTRCPMELAIWLADKPVVRAWGQYLAGLLWTMHRVHTGGTADFPFYFLGEVSASGSRACFPVVYAIKEALPWHLLSAWALLLALVRVWSSAWGVRPLLSWLRGHPAETCMLGWLVLYWGWPSSRTSISGCATSCPSSPSRWCWSPVSSAGGLHAPPGPCGRPAVPPESPRDRLLAPVAGGERRPRLPVLPRILQ
jgi:hypothetical protein